MKTILKTMILGAIAAIALTGCGMGAKPVLPTPMKVKKVESGVIKVTQKVNVSSDSLRAQYSDNRKRYAATYKIGLDAAFKKAAQETLKSGNTHFILVAKNSNGLKGFPLNTVSDVHAYCNGGYLTDSDLKNKCGKDGLINYNGRTINLSVFPLKNPSYTISAFDAKAVLSESK